MSQPVQTRTETHSQLRTNQIKGYLMVLTGASLWGGSGCAAQILFQTYSFSPGWLVSVRMGSSGLLLLMFVLMRYGWRETVAVWKNPRDAGKVILYGLIGLLGVQYCYFETVHVSNAAWATLLQFMGPVFITLYLLQKERRLPKRGEVLAVLLAVLGTFLLVFDGRWNHLETSGLSLFWGLLSALAAAFYTLYPKPLLAVYKSPIIVGWSMLVGSIGLSFLAPPWDFHGTFTGTAWMLFLFIVLLGTLVAFSLYLGSLRYLTAQETGLLGCAEPLSAAIISVAFLNVPFGLAAFAGGTCIVLTVVILSRLTK